MKDQNSEASHLTDYEKAQRQKELLDMAKIEAMGKLLDGTPHLSETKFWTYCPGHCSRCAWEKLKES